MDSMESDKRRKRFKTCSEDDMDMIGNLPEHLIDSILERLPIEDAVRTSILSKKWRYKWTTMKVLYFNCQFSEKMSKKGAFAHNGFIRTINKIMINHDGPISTFRLGIPNIVLDSFQEVDQWMLILSRNNVTELILYSYRIYPLPSSVFSCLELRMLELRNCIFKPPVEFQGFPNLEEIYFKNVRFGGRSVINLPQLKKLGLDTCVNVNNFNIKAVNLQILWVVNCPDAMLLWLLGSEHLDFVRVCVSQPIERVEGFNLATLLCNLPNIATLTIDGYFLKFLAAEKFPKWLPHPVKCLRQLDFLSFSFGDLDHVQGALCVLRNSPSLKVLRVTLVQMGSNADLALASSYLEPPDDLLQVMLKSVEITSIEGSRPELLFIKLLLNHSPNLEDMIIRPRATADAQKKLNIAKDVMMFPRASNKAKMIYLDPQP